MTSSAPAIVPGASPRSHLRFAEALLDELRRRDPDGRLVPAATDVTQAALLAVDQVLDTRTQWTEQIGPFYATDTVRSLLGGDAPVSRQAVYQRRGLLALSTGSGQIVYPVAQFRGRRLPPGLDRVLAALPDELVSRWTVASWLLSPEVALAGERPVDVLFDGDEAAINAVVMIARQWSARLAA